jgi:hypothetical protein
MTLRFVWPVRIGAVLLLLIYGTPLLWLVTTSLKTPADVYRGISGFLVFTPTLAAYQRIWNADLLHSAINSLLIAAGTTGGTKSANPTGWTPLSDVTTQTPHLFSAYRLPGATGTYNAAWTITSAKSTGGIASFVPG